MGYPNEIHDPILLMKMRVRQTEEQLDIEHKILNSMLERHRKNCTPRCFSEGMQVPGDCAWQHTNPDYRTLLGKIGGMESVLSLYRSDMERLLDFFDYYE